MEPTLNFGLKKKKKKINLFCIKIQEWLQTIFTQLLALEAWLLYLLESLILLMSKCKTLSYQNDSLWHSLSMDADDHTEGAMQ